MAYAVPPLPYDYNALEPHIDEETMHLHHDKHHQAYVTTSTRRSRAPSGPTSRSRRCSRTSARCPTTSGPRSATTAAATTTTRCSGSGCRPTAAASPTARWPRRSTSAFGSFDDFKAQFKDAGVRRFGSGWAWLVHDGSGLAIVSTANQDNPISDGKTPLLGVDVWEHAYYLKYQNRRPDYLDAWWNVVNWAEGRRSASPPPAG